MISGPRVTELELKTIRSNQEILGLLIALITIIWKQGFNFVSTNHLSTDRYKTLGQREKIT